MEADAPKEEVKMDNLGLPPKPLKSINNFKKKSSSRKIKVEEEEVKPIRPLHSKYLLRKAIKKIKNEQNG